MIYLDFPLSLNTDNAQVNAPLHNGRQLPILSHILITC